MVSTDLSGSKVPSTPSSKESRRRTWFGLVTPKRRERASVVPQATVVEATSSSLDGNNMDSVEELDTTPIRQSPGDAFVSRQWPVTDDEYEDDSDREGTVRRKSSKSKQRPQLLIDSDNEHDPGPVRMKDTATLAILSRNNTAKPKSFPARIFGRSASDSSGDALPAPRPNTLVLTPSRVPQRSSSVTTSPGPVGERVDSSPVNKPLPFLPPDDGHSTLSNGAAPRAVSLPISPAPPTDIVVTPSSPLDPFDSLFGLGPGPSLSLPSAFGSSSSSRPVSATPASAPVSRTPSMHAPPRASRPESPTPTRTGSVGLGLPASVAAKRASSSHDQSYMRPQAVSSPLPGRSASPVVKVTFSAAETTKPQDRKLSAKNRPRSLSSMFSRAPAAETAPTTDDEEASSGVFGWLGVNKATKTIKRRRSESKLRKRRSGFFSSEKDPGPSETSTDDQSFSERPPLRTRLSTNASTPMLINRSVPDVAATTKPAHSAHSAGSSLSSLPVIDQNEFWPAQQWAATGAPSIEVETMSMETATTTTTTSQSDLKRDVTSAAPAPAAPVPIPSTARDGAVARRLLLDTGSQRSSAPSSPLSSLPELGRPPTIAENIVGDAGAATPPPQVTPRSGRGRSFSDAARHFQPEETITSSPRSLRSPSEVDLSHSQRPPLGSRSNSSSSAVFGMVRSVFTKNRPRSNSTLRYGSSTDDSDFVTNEFGARDSGLPRPESSASSLGPSPALPPVRIRPEDVPQVSTLALQFGDDDRRVVLAETPERSPRSSYAASQSSRTTLSTRRSHTADPHGPNAYGHGALPSHSGVPGLRVGRARAQTVSSGALSWHGTVGSTTVSHGHGPAQRASHDNSLAPPSAFGGSSTYLPAPTTPTFPIAATPPRQRPGSIRRLSTGLFRSNPSSPKPPSGQLFPLPPRGPGAGSSGGPSPANEEGPSRSASPLPLSRSATPVQRLSVDTVDTAVHDNDTPESWLARLANVDRRELAGILAASADEFHTAALTLYMNRFDFTHIALDVALRRFLMHMSLPKETQQIDRVIEAFATRYDRCEPGLFGTKDNAYVLGFSMMMLHTDAFNRHNKNKMTKPDYVRNTRLEGVPPPVLEAFYDNITFTPFVFIEDDNEAALAAAGVPAHYTNGSARSGKIDVYDLIVGGQLGSLRVDVERVIPADSPFSCMGTRPFLDVDRLQRSFANAHPLQFVNSRPRRKSSVPLAQLGGGGANVPLTPKEEVTTLKITKVGLISRKDDTPTTKRTGARKWRSWSVILTGSQLLFFKDTIWALTLVEQIRSASKSSPDQPVVPRMNKFQPDEVLSVKGSVAVFDRDYSASPHTFRFVMSDGRQFLMQLNDEYEMNEWLTLINYASTFKTAAIRMRAAGLNSGDAVKAGSVAAEEHLRAVESGNGYQPPESSQVRSVLFADSDAQEESASPVAATPRPRLRRVGSLRSSPAPIVDITGANDVVVNGGEQMEAVIGSVKAELAAGRAGTSRPLTMPSELAAAADTPTKTIRSEAIQQRVQVLKSEAAVIEQRLTTDLRIARNLAILTPFQKSTRDHIEQALPDLANQIRSDRVELSKLHLWITMLLKDQDRDQRDWARVRHVALQAAARSLCGPVTDKADRRATIAAPIAIPKLSLPDPDDDREKRWSDHSGAFASGQASPGELPVTNPMSDDEHDHDHKRTPTPSFTPTFVAVPEQTDDISPPAPSPTSPTSPTSARSTSNPTSDSDDYELAPEYLGSTDSLREEMERQLAFSATTHSISSLAANGPTLPNAAPAPTPGGLQVPVRDELRDDVEASHDQPEHWRNTRAATKVSLAHLPRSSLGELSRKFIKIDGNDIVLNAD